MEGTGAPAANAAAGCAGPSCRDARSPTDAPRDSCRKPDLLTGLPGESTIALVPYLQLIDVATQYVTEIREPVARLGRSPECSVVLGGDVAGVVSAVHAELRHSAGEWRLADLASRNGTFLNGRRVEAATVPHVGDVTSFGGPGPPGTCAPLWGGPGPAVGRSSAWTAATRRPTSPPRPTEHSGLRPSRATDSRISVTCRVATSINLR